VGEEEKVHVFQGETDDTLTYIILITIIVLGTAIASVGVFVCCVRTQPKAKDLEAEHEQLIQGGDPRRFPPYSYQPQAAQYELPAVYFPAVAEMS
jgi:hypothetical protein